MPSGESADPSERASSRAAWSRYWRHGALHSCTGAYAGNYDGAVAEFWQRCFAQLPDGATIVDIGTGNGAIALLASRQAASSRMARQVHGVDSAECRPNRHGDDDALAGVVFHPNTSAEQLPFSDRSVDLLCGQYSLEYMDLDRVLPEFRRVLRADGGLIFVVHAQDSAVTRVARQEDLVDTWLLDDSGYFSAARELLRHMVRYRPDAWRRRDYDASARLAHERFSGLASECARRRQTQSQTQVLAAAVEQFAVALGRLSENGLDAALAHLEEVQDELRAHHRRLREQLSAALDRAGIDALCARIETAGLGTPQVDGLAEGEIALGWTVRSRSGAPVVGPATSIARRRF